MTPSRGRGRPTLFTPHARDRYLTLLASGLTQAQAAVRAGVTARTVQLTAKADPAFAAAGKKAMRTGRAARAASRAAEREENMPHGESRYNHLGCRCPICTKAATEARAGRPDRQPQPAPRARLVTLTPPATDAPARPFPLARAS